MSRLVPAFDPSRSANASDTCRLHSRQFVDALGRLELWALQMHDATAKIPSGVLSGNVNQYGDYDECLDVAPPTHRFNGKYCLAHIQITVPDHLPQLRRIRKLLHSHDAFVNDFDDPGHRVPRFSMINFGVCVPSTCSHTDVQQSLTEYMADFTAGTPVQFELRVDSGMCYVKQASALQPNTKLAIGFFVLVVGMAVCSTLIEIYVDKPNGLLTSFSLWRNSKALISLDRSPNDISTIHGIRFINAFLLLFSHKSMAAFYNPYVNRTKMVESIGDYVSVLGRAAAVYTDAFIMLSGLLTAYTIFGRLQAKQSPRILQEYLSRFLRIAPMLGALILFCTFVLPEMGDGPQWNLVINRHADICKVNWWRNMLFIHNYFGFANMCLTHTHHLGIDTQLFLISPILILILWKWPRPGLFAMLGMAAFSTVARFHVTVAHQLSNYVYFGASIKQLFSSADLMYSIPLHRATIYIYGILIGYAMRMYPNAKLSKMQLLYGWSISVLLLAASLLAPAKMGSMTYQYNAYDAATYAALSPITWCTLFAWIIYTSHIGYTNLITDMLSCRLFLITTRIAYGVYLTQFPIFFYNVGTTRSAGYYSFIPTMGNLYEIIAILATSIVLTLLFDTPFQNIKQYTMQRTRLVSRAPERPKNSNGLKQE